MGIDLTRLNESQRKAVEWPDEPLLVLAGPGSGKTSVLAYRVAHLVSRSEGKRFRVLGLTFTNKAATEMRERVIELIPSGSERVLLTTFHAFAADILRQHGSHVGVAPDFTILNTEEDRIELFRLAINSAIEAGEDVNEDDYVLLPLLTNLLEKRVGESAIRGRIRDEDLGTKLRTLYGYYRTRLDEHNVLDFPCLILLACDLLQQFPAIVRHYRLIYPYICVDEFQDTNVSQFELLSALVANDPKGLFVVADDDQIVYQWNGASPQRLEDLRTRYQMMTLELPQNYRCPAPIIDIANRLISHNANRNKSAMTVFPTPTPQRPNPLRIRSFDTPDEEADWVASDISNLAIEQREYCVVLARTKTLVERVANALTVRQVAVTLSVKKNEFVSSPLKWLHSMLRLANARGDKEQLRKLCSSFYDLEGVSLVHRDIIAASSALGGDLFRSFLEEALARRASMDAACTALLLGPAQDLADRMAYQEFSRAAFSWFEQVRESSAATNTETGAEVFLDYEEEKTVWNDLCAGIARKHSTDDPSLNLLLQEIDLSPKQPPAPPNAVRCYTIHTAKGMEFNDVYLIGMAEDILPSYQSTRKGDASAEMQEERRNCFVAITRTKQCLTLTRARHYYGYQKEPSRFLAEMGFPNT